MSELFKKKINKIIGKNIRTIRHQLGWTQEDIAIRLGISIPAFSKIETSFTDINLSRLEQIANIYEIEVTQLFSLDMEDAEFEPSKMSITQKKLADQEAEINKLQRKVISLYEELEKKELINSPVNF
jgi:transcriptional regulator with XRE-family HTH domain